MVLNVSLDGGSTWSLCTPGLVDFEQYPALELRFVEGVHEEELPSWIYPRVLDEECQRPLDLDPYYGGNVRTTKDVTIESD